MGRINTLCCMVIFLAKGNNGLLCYSCKDVSKNETCLNVTKCPTGEACYGRADGFHTGEVKHTFGCTRGLDVPKTVVSTGLSFCSSICHENFCNLNECRPGNTNNRLRCLSCGLVNDPNDCKVVKECLEGEICLAEKIETFGKSKYRLGCVRHQDCSLRRISTSQIIGKRTAVKNCSVCCKTDYCNLDACSANMSAQILQLNPVSPNAVCEDDDPKLCATLGRFNADACSDPYVVEKCPKSCVACDHFGWTEWGSYSYCSQTCSFGTKTRTRECYHRLDISMNKACVGNATEQEQCYIIMDCPPVNGGWCYRQMTPYCNYNAAVAGACLSSYLVRSNCACPPPQYGGLPCR